MDDASSVTKTCGIQTTCFVLLAKWEAKRQFQHVGSETVLAWSHFFNGFAASPSLSEGAAVVSM